MGRNQSISCGVLLVLVLHAVPGAAQGYALCAFTATYTTSNTDYGGARGEAVALFTVSGVGCTRIGSVAIRHNREPLT